MGQCGVIEDGFSGPLFRKDVAGLGYPRFTGIGRAVYQERTQNRGGGGEAEGIAVAAEADGNARFDECVDPLRSVPACLPDGEAGAAGLSIDADVPAEHMCWVSEVRAEGLSSCRWWIPCAFWGRARRPN